MTDMMAAQAWRTNAHMLADLFRIMPKLRPISMGRANDVVAMMGDRPITWWFDSEIARLGALRAELVALEASAIKKGVVVRCPELEIGAESGGEA